MTLVADRRYDFRMAAHWAAGARHSLELDGDALVVPQRLRIEPLPGARAADAGALPAVDPRGDPVWLRPRSRELVHRASAAVIERGILSGPVPARLMIAGRTVVWVLADESLDRYDAATLQRLTPAELRSGWRISGAAGDAADGLWVTEADSSGRWRLRHVDCWGRTCLDPIPVAGATGAELSVAAVAGGTGLVVLDPLASAIAIVIDAGSGEVVREIGLDQVHRGRPTLLTAAPDDRIHLLTSIGEPGSAVYESINVTDGDVEDHQDLSVPAALGGPTALAGDLLACSRGLGRSRPWNGTTDERWSTFITPGLVSPVGPRSGWNRAEMDVVLPAGTAMEVAWAATDNAWLADQAAHLIDGPATANLVDKLDELLPWRDEGAVTYRGTGDDVEHLAALLDDVQETTLWLRIRLQTPPGRTSPKLARLCVRYPDISYLEHLPALYREDPRSARELRRILAPYELMLDGLDQELAALPARIDPRTAGDDWTDFLLSWLGFPPLGDLPATRRRDLLEHAPDILRLQGTREGLQLLLDVVTGNRATITDVADEPAAWFLGAADSSASGAAPARLGHDTVALAQQPRPSLAGAMVLGRTPLGEGCPDPALMLGLRVSEITITLELDPDGGRVLGPIIERLLSVFAPAHARLRKVSTGADGASRSRRLDADFRLGPDGPADGAPPYDSLLHGDAHWRLGATTRLDHWALPEPALPPAVLDHGPVLSTGPRLR